MTGQVSDGGHSKEEQENNPLFLRPCDSECYCEKKKMIGHGGGAIEREREREREKEKKRDLISGEIVVVIVNGWIKFLFLLSLRDQTFFSLLALLFKGNIGKLFRTFFPCLYMASTVPGCA